MSMTRTAGLVEAPSWSIRSELPVDLDQIHELHRQAFGGRTDEADLVDAIRSGAGFIPGLSLVAVGADGTVFGHILMSRVAFDEGLDGGVRRDVLALAPLAVLPAHGGRGIGSALVREVLAVSDAMAEPFVAVVGAPSFYGQFGFVAALPHGIHGPYDDAGEAFQARPRPGSTLVPGSVSYPAAFDGL